MGRVDVIIPCHNYGRFLRQSVESALAQPGLDVRVLILDDASTDNSAEVGAALAREDARVEFRRHAVNRGHIATYNEGLAWATGDYLLLISADDLVTPGALGRAAQVMDAHPEVGLTYGRQVLFETDPPRLEPSAPAAGEVRILGGLEFIERCCEGGDNPVPTPAAVVRTAVQHAVGGYRPELPHTADLEMWLRFAVRGSIAVIDAAQALKRLHGASMQRRLHGARLTDLEQRRDAFESLFRHHGDHIAGAARLRATARRKLAEHAFWDASRAFDAGDADSCDRLLDLAARTAPEIRTSRSWRRLAVKRRLGPRLSRALSRVLSRRSCAPQPAVDRIGV